MGNILENLTEAINKLESSVKKDLAEIRQQKKEVQQMQEAIRQNNPNVQYVRDDKCLILSAPHVIIGNVDRNGVLYSGGSSVIIRGNAISNEATGAEDVGGTIINRATTIRNVAVDPGMDGRENVVYSNSRITNQARSITLQSNDETGAFSVSASVATGVNILSDTSVDVSALAQNKTRKEAIESKIKYYENLSKEYSEKASKYKKNLDIVIENIGKIITDQGDLNDSSDDLATNYQELYGYRHDVFKQQEQMLYTLSANYVACLSSEAEAERCITALKATKSDLDSATSNFDEDGTMSSINLNSENIGITSVDGDGSLRENATAGLYVNAPHVALTSYDKKGGLVKDSTIMVNTEKLDISTANPAYDDEKRAAGQFPATGDVIITSKNVTVQAIDQELKDEEMKEKELTKEGKFILRAENIVATATDTEGKSTGVIALNAKKMNIAAMDVDKETREDKEMAAGSQLTVLAEKNLMGTSEKTKLIQLAADQVGLIAKTTAEMQQDGKAVVTASGGNLTAGGSKVELQGNTTISGNAKIAGETTTPKLSSDQVEAKSAFKSPNINDTMGAGVPGQAASPSAKMKEEEAKTTK